MYAQMNDDASEGSCGWQCSLYAWRGGENVVVVEVDEWAGWGGVVA